MANKKKIALIIGGVLLAGAAVYGFIIWRKKKQLDQINNPMGNAENSSLETSTPSEVKKLSSVPVPPKKSAGSKTQSAKIATAKMQVNAPTSNDYTTWVKGRKLYATKNTTAVRPDGAKLKISAGALAGSYLGETKVIGDTLNAMVGVSGKAYGIPVNDLK
jgi:hypothetical protein